MNWQAILDPTLCGRLCMTLVHSLWQVAILAVLAWGAGQLLLRKSPRIGYAVHVAALLVALAAMPITFALVDVNPTDGSNGTSISRTSAGTLMPNEPSADNTTPTPGAAVPITPTANRIAANRPSERGVPAPASVKHAAAASIPPESSPNPPQEKPSLLWPRVAPWLAAIYLLGVLLMLARLIRGMWTAQRLAATAELLADGPLADRLKSLAQAWSMRAVPLLAKSEAVVVPKVIGLLRPMILLPVSAVGGLSTEELEMILAHELAHVRRYDMWVNLLQRMAEAVLFFNPALWILSRRISTLREYCCDELTCGTGLGTGDTELRTRYASALLRVVEVSGRTPQPADVATLAAGRSPSELRRRVSRLFGEPLPEPVRLSRGGLIAVLALTAAMIVGPAAWKTVAAPEESTNDGPAEIVPLDEFPSAVAAAVRGELEEIDLPFVEKTDLDAIEREFGEFVERHVPDELSEERRTAILESLRHCGKTHLAIAGKVRGDSVRSANRAYLGLPDALKTLRWKLWMAMRRGPLSDKEQAELDLQREWMREVISDLPEERPLERADVLGRLQERFDDPLCTPLDRPMNAARFASFQAAIQKYLREASTGVEESTPTSIRSIRPHNPLPFVNSRFVRWALAVRWSGEKGAYLFPLFDEDPILGWGCGLNMRLNFESNRAHRGNNPALDDFDKGGTVMDATTGYPLSIPPRERKTGASSKWLTEVGRGDLIYKGDFIYKDGALTAVRGARLLPLDVTTWYEADAISDADLRTRIEKEGQTAVSLNSAFEEFKGEHGVYPPAEYIGPYVGVLTKEGRLAVVHVYDFSTLTSIGVHTRVREDAADGRKDAESRAEEDKEGARRVPSVLSFGGDVKSCAPIGTGSSADGEKALVVSNDPRYRMVVAVVSAPKDDPLLRQGTDVALAIHSPSRLFHGDAKTAVGKRFRFRLHGALDDGRRTFFHIEAEETGATPEPPSGEDKKDYCGRDRRCRRPPAQIRT